MILVQDVRIVKIIKKKITNKLVVNNPLNKPGWVILITDFIKGLFNFCHHDVDMLLKFEGLDCMRKLLRHMSARKPERMLCQKRNN